MFMSFFSFLPESTLFISSKGALEAIVSFDKFSMFSASLAMVSHSNLARGASFETRFVMDSIDAVSGTPLLKCSGEFSSGECSLLLWLTVESLLMSSLPNKVSGLNYSGVNVSWSLLLVCSKMEISGSQSVEIIAEEASAVEEEGWMSKMQDFY